MCKFFLFVVLCFQSASYSLSKKNKEIIRYLSSEYSHQVAGLWLNILKYSNQDFAEEYYNNTENFNSHDMQKIIEILQRDIDDNKNDEKDIYTNNEIYNENKRAIRRTNIELAKDKIAKDKIKYSQRSHFYDDQSHEISYHRLNRDIIDELDKICKENGLEISDICYKLSLQDESKYNQFVSWITLTHCKDVSQANYWLRMVEETDSYIIAEELAKLYQDFGKLFADEFFNIFKTYGKVTFEKRKNEFLKRYHKNKFRKKDEFLYWLQILEKTNSEDVADRLINFHYEYKIFKRKVLDEFANIYLIYGEETMNRYLQGFVKENENFKTADEAYLWIKILKETGSEKMPYEFYKNKKKHLKSQYKNKI